MQKETLKNFIALAIDSDRPKDLVKRSVMELIDAAYTPPKALNPFRGTFISESGLVPLRAFDTLLPPKECQCEMCKAFRQAKKEPGKAVNIHIDRLQDVFVGLDRAAAFLRPAAGPDPSLGQGLKEFLSRFTAGDVCNCPDCTAARQLAGLKKTPSNPAAATNGASPGPDTQTLKGKSSAGQTFVDFSDALRLLKMGNKLARRAWTVPAAGLSIIGGLKYYLELDFPGAAGVQRIHTRYPNGTGDGTPVILKTEDVLATDWFIV